MTLRERYDAGHIDLAYPACQNPAMPKTVVFHADVQLPNSQVPKDGTVMNEDFYDRLLRASDYGLKRGDAILVYKPDPNANGTEELLLCLIHKAIPDYLCMDMLPILRTVARSSVPGGRRNKAAGTQQLPQYKKDGSRSKVKAVPKLNDPLMKEEDRIRLRGAMDGTVGSLAPGVTAGQHQECRLSYWSKHHTEEMNALMPLVKEVNKAFQKYARTRIR